MKAYFDLLLSTPLFQGIDPQDLEPMLHCLGASTVTVPKGDPVFLEGDAAGFIGVVLEGHVQVVQEDFYGNRSILAHIGPGELFGESYACAGIPSLPVSIVAAEDCRIMLIDCQHITTSCSNACGFHNQMIHNLLRVVANKNLLFHQKIEITSRRSTREKLMAYLLHQAKLHGSSEFTIPYDRQALADYLGVERSAMSAEISKLRRDGVIECDKSRFRLLQ